MENLNIGDLVEIKVGTYQGSILPIVNLAYQGGVIWVMVQPENRIVSLLETDVEKHHHFFEENGLCFRCGATMGRPN